MLKYLLGAVVGVVVGSHVGIAALGTAISGKLLGGVAGAAAVKKMSSTKRRGDGK